MCPLILYTYSKLETCCLFIGLQELSGPFRDTVVSKPKKSSCHRTLKATTTLSTNTIFILLHENVLCDSHRFDPHAPDHTSGIHSVISPDDKSTVVAGPYLGVRFTSRPPGWLTTAVRALGLWQSPASVNFDY